MKRYVVAALSVSAVVLLATVAGAQMGWGPGPGMMGQGAGPGWGQMGPGMMGPGAGWGGQGGWGQMGPGMMGPGWSRGGPGPYECPGWYGYGPEAAAPQLTEEKAKEIAQQYADRYLAGYKVDKVLPFTGMRGATMYSVELKGPGDEVRTLHVNPWGNVMPYGGPWRRTG